MIVIWRLIMTLKTKTYAIMKWLTGAVNLPTNQKFKTDFSFHEFSMK